MREEPLNSYECAGDRSAKILIEDVAVEGMNQPGPVSAVEPTHTCDEPAESSSLGRMRLQDLRLDALQQSRQGDRRLQIAKAQSAPYIFDIDWLDVGFAEKFRAFPFGGLNLS
jgi:hypothetical protein